MRVYLDDGKRWALYSRHRDWGRAANRAYTEARNAYSTRVELIDSREVDRTKHKENDMNKKLKVKTNLKAGGVDVNHTRNLLK